MAKMIKKWLAKSSNTLRIGINLWPPFLGAGIKILSISSDFREVKVVLKLRWYNTNYVGTHFGGSMFAMTDPFYMLILIQNLGKDYIVWDKAAQIQFKKPGRGKLSATFTFSLEEIDAVKHQADNNEKYIFDRSVDIFNEQGEVVATVTRTLYVKRKNEESLHDHTEK